MDFEKEDEYVAWSLMKMQELRDEFQFYGFHTVEELEYIETPEGKSEAKLKKWKKTPEKKLKARSRVVVRKDYIRIKS